MDGGTGGAYLRITNYELRITIYDLRFTIYDLENSAPLAQFSGADA